MTDDTPGLVHDAAQHHPDACSRNYGPNDSTTQTLDEMTCPDCLRYIIRSTVTTPYEPPGLRDLVDSITYKRGWTFALVRDVEPDGSGGLALHIISHTKNSYRPDMDIRVRHAFLVPPASYSRDTWAAWLFDRVRDVEDHEAGEFFMLDGYREFAPHHGNGEDPYRVWHVGDHAAARKRAGED
jgi:hypothetical protein